MNNFKNGTKQINREKNILSINDAEKNAYSYWKKLIITPISHCLQIMPQESSQI